MNVVDASAVVKLLLDEPRADAARKWFAANAARLASTHLLPFEVGNVLAREIPREDAAALGQLAESLLQGIDLRPVAPVNVFAVRGALSYYDASYLALAKAEGATLVTCDKKMVAAARTQKVPVQTF